MTYTQACDYLFALPRFSKQSIESWKTPTLAKTEYLLEKMGRPADKLKIIHLAGTNGKGSTASMIAAIATASGMKVGLHTSPHLVSFTERMRINGRPADEEWITSAVKKWQPLFEEVKPSFFEASVVLSFLYFADQSVDLAVIETGMGGRFDATNVVRPMVTLITNIAKDHTAQLGNTFAEIAREKAGIIKQDIPVFTAVTKKNALKVIYEVAEAKNASFEDINLSCEITHNPKGITINTPAGSYQNMQIELAGEHQITNACLAIRVAETVFESNEDQIRQGLQNIVKFSGLRGRCQILKNIPGSTYPALILDVAHNFNSLAASLRLINQIKHPDGKLVILFGIMKDKNLTEMIDLFDANNTHIIPVSDGSERSLPAEELAQFLNQRNLFNQKTPNSIEEAVVDAQKRASLTGDLVLITGSHYIAGRILSALSPV